MAAVQARHCDSAASLGPQLAGWIPRVTCSSVPSHEQALVQRDRCHRHQNCLRLVRPRRRVGRWPSAGLCDAHTRTHTPHTHACTAASTRHACTHTHSTHARTPITVASTRCLRCPCRRCPCRRCPCRRCPCRHCPCRRCLCRRCLCRHCPTHGRRCPRRPLLCLRSSTVNL